MAATFQELDILHYIMGQAAATHLLQHIKAIMLTSKERMFMASKLALGIQVIILVTAQVVGRFIFLILI